MCVMNSNEPIALPWGTPVVWLFVAYWKGTQCPTHHVLHMSVIYVLI